MSKRLVQNPFAFSDQTLLGFDPTIQPAEDDEKQFIITIHHDHDHDKNDSRTFHTLKLLPSYGAEPLRGRGTRVFEAVELDGQGNQKKGSPVVLKDIWIDGDRKREGAIVALLRAAPSGEDKQLVEKHSLTAVCHGDVWTDTNTLDDTENALKLGLKIPKGPQFPLQRKQRNQKYWPASRSQRIGATSGNKTPQSHFIYASKTHYRIVFEEKGDTIDSIKSLPDVITVLIGIVTGAFSNVMIHLSALTFAFRITAVAKVGMGTRRRECWEYIFV
jgi:hypothetical protein